MEIQELTTYTPEVFAEIAPLMKQLSERCVFTKDKLKATIEDAGCHLYVMLDNGRIVGCSCLCVFNSPTGTKASIEDVVVSVDYRGQHLGRQLMEYVLEQAHQYAPLELHLTSNPIRVAANRLYQSLGFEKKETNCYQMNIGL